MKNALITLCSGDNYKNMKELTCSRMLNYCKKFSLDFHIIEEERYKHPAYNKLQIKNYINDYERLLYLDIDVIVRKDAPNIFDIVPLDKFGIFNEEPLEICKCGQETIDLYKEYVYTNVIWNKEYYNTGVMLFNKDNINTLNDDLPYLEELYADQGYINFQIQYKKIKCFDIGYKFNGLNNGKIYGRDRLLNSYFIHMNGNGTFENKYNFLQKEINEVEKLECELNL